MAELPEMMPYFNQPLGLMMEVPSEWQGQMVDVNHLRISAPELPDHGGYRPGMSIRRGHPGPEFNEGLDKVISASGQEMAASYPEFSLVKEEHLRMGENSPAFVRYYQWRDARTGLHFSQIQAIVLWAKDVLFLINAATLKEVESQSLPIFDAILRSLRTLPPQPTS